MDKCVGKFFIYNEVLSPCEDFQDKMKLQGITIYEVIRIIDAVPLFIEEHLHRLENSSRLSNIKLNYSWDEIIKNIQVLIKENNIEEGNIKLIFNLNKEVLFSAFFIPHSYPKEEMYLKGVRTIVFHGERENPNVKAVNASFRENVDRKIKEAGVYEAILVDRNSFVTEGSKSNIFMIKDRDVITAPLKDVLPGVTRERVIKIAKKLNINVIERNVNYKELFKMDALFITGTSPKILPISNIDEVNVNSTKNDILYLLMDEYNKLICDYIAHKQSI